MRLSTWTQIFPNETFESAWNLDPNNELDLTEAQREKLDNVSLDRFIEEVDAILAPYNVDISLLGDIHARAGGPRKSLQKDLHEGDLREKLRTIDISDAYGALNTSDLTDPTTRELVLERYEPRKITITSLTVTAETWELKDRSGELFAEGEWRDSLNVEDEDFDFDGVTALVGELAGVELENTQDYTESSTDGWAYWTVAGVGVQRVL